MRSRRVPFVLLLVYVGFVVYGSLFPFDFTYDPERTRRFLALPFPRLHDADGRHLVSLPDVVSNILLDVVAQVTGALAGLLVAHALAGGSSRASGPRLASAPARLPALALVLGAALGGSWCWAWPRFSRRPRPGYAL